MVDKDTGLYTPFQAGSCQHLPDDQMGHLFKNLGVTQSEGSKVAFVI